MRQLGFTFVIALLCGWLLPLLLAGYYYSEWLLMDERARDEHEMANSMQISMLAKDLAEFAFNWAAISAVLVLGFVLVRLISNRRRFGS